jgi:homocysteine S-methyltransferase
MAVLACLGIERPHLWNSGVPCFFLEGVQLRKFAAYVNDRNAILRGIHILDGGMASELEHQGANIDGPLWSAHVLEDGPEKVIAVHRAYIEAGAECILTASYQVSRMGYAEFGLAPERADAALLRAVELARSAAAEFPGQRVLVAASLGPYGAALHNGAEYHGNYEVGSDELVAFHRERIQVLANAADAQRPDLLAFETLPSLEEAEAIGEALVPWPDLAAWFSFTCKNGQHVAHGELLGDCAAAVARFPQTVAIGVNCTQPALIPALIRELRRATDKTIVVYPNSGEGWDASTRHWTGSNDAAEFGEMTSEWFAAGAQIVGGCCRTRPAHIRQVAQEAARIWPSFLNPEQYS